MRVKAHIGNIDIVPRAVTAALQPLELGDYDGHPFRGNQYTGGIQDGSSARPFRTSSAEEAAALIAQGLYVVMPAEQVSVLLDKLAEYARDAKAAGERATNYDLCKVTVPDTNLFCAESKGIPRVEMPQLSGFPLEGSLAAKLPKNEFGETDITTAFREQLSSDGFKFDDLCVPAAQLKATQNELNGAKVAGIMQTLEAGRLPPGRIFVSSDNYVVDGHHRWAANVGEDYDDAKAGDVNIDVTRVNLPISELLDYSRSFANHMGIPQQDVGTGPVVVSAAEFGDSEGHPFHGNQWTNHGSSHEMTDAEKRLTPDEHERIYGGLHPEDYPYGHIPGMAEIAAQYAHPEDVLEEGRMFRGSLEWTAEEQQQARDSLAEKLRTEEPTVRMPLAAFKEMIADGEIRNQWETGKTGAATGASDSYVPKRGAAETTSLGVPEDATPAERPVYGYLAPGDRADYLDPKDPHDRELAYKYVVHDDEKRERIFANPDDYVIGITASRYNAGEGAYIGVYSKDFIATRYQDPEEAAQEARETRFYPLGDGNGNVNDPVWFGRANSEYSANQYGDVQITLKRDVLDGATVTGGDSIDAHLMGVPARLAEAGDRRIPIGMATYLTDLSGRTMVNYTELQMKDHPTLADIETVRFTGAKPTRAVQAQLDEAEITWTHEPMLKLSRSQTIPFDEVVGTAPSPVDTSQMTDEQKRALYREMH